MVDKTALHQRIGELELEVAALRESAGLAPQKGLFGLLRATSRFLVAHWVLVSFLSGLFVAVYVKETFDIDYFESYRRQATQKKIADIHRRLGDRLMGSSEWEAAEESYRLAIAADSNCEAATQGLLKASVFAPTAGQVAPSREMVAARLQYIGESFGEDYLYFFLKAAESLDRRDLDDVERYSRCSIEQNPAFAGAHLNLGYMLMGTYDATSRELRFDLARAADCFAEAARLSPESSSALNNLGECRFLQRQFAAAADHFERANAISQTLLTDLNLGEAYRALGRFEDAWYSHRVAHQNAMQPSLEATPYFGGASKLNLLPLHDADGARAAAFVEVTTVEAKRALAKLQLSFSLALVGQVAAADQHFVEGFNAEAKLVLIPLLANRIEAVELMPNVEPWIRAWFASKKAQLGS